MSQSLFARRGFLIVLVMVFLCPFVLRGTRLALKSNRNDVRDWLPEEFEETATHRWFRSHFPHERFILVSWDGCTLDDRRLEFFAKKLEALGKEPAAGGGGIPATSMTAASLAPGEKDKGNGDNGEKPEKPKRLFKDVLTGTRLVERLQAAYPDLAEEDVLARLEGSLIGEDHDRTCLVATLSPGVRHEDLRPTLDTIRRIAADECSIPAETLRLGGPPVDNVAIDVEGERTLLRLALLSAAVGLGISWLCFRSVRLTALVFWCAILAAGFGLASVFWLDFLVTGLGLVSGDWTYGSVDAVLLSMPSLVFVLALSGAIHIVNYYHDAIHEKAGLEGAPDRALRHAWYPCTIAALTTAVGLGSLVTSHVVPISKFGMYSAWGVMATLVVLFLFLPALLHYFPSRKYADEHAGQQHVDEKDNPFVRWWRFIGGKVIRHNGWVVAGCVAVMVFFALGIHRVKTSVKLMKLFSPGAEIIRHYTWLEDQLGPLVPMEIVIRFDNQKCEQNFLDRMRLVQDVEYAIESLPDVGGALSAATFAPDITPDDGLLAQRADYVLNKRLQDGRDAFGELGYLSTDPDRDEVRKKAEKDRGEVRDAPNAMLDELAGAGVPDPVIQKLKLRKLNDLQAILAYAGKDSVEGRLESMRGIDPQQAAAAAAAIQKWRDAHGEELWRVSARVAALGDVDYGLFVDDIKEKVEPVLAAYREAGYEGVDATYTGVVPLVYKTQHELMRGLFSSLTYAFILIAFVMMLVLRSPSAGLLAMIPNLFPVVLIFGVMGWSGILVDVGSMMTASVALGVAVDDTIHYLTWYRQGLDRGLDRQGAAMLAYERCATALTQTTLIAGLGLAAFCFSTFTPTQRFGTLMLTILVAALVGDLIFLPALLTGPLGRFFGGRRRKAPPQPESRLEDAARAQAAPAEIGPSRQPIGDEPVSVSGDGHTRHTRPDRAHRPSRTS